MTDALSAPQPAGPHTGPRKGPCIGIDLGGTKIEGLLIGADGEEIARRRISSPRNDYAATISAVIGLVRALEHAASLDTVPVGLGIPGSISRETGLVQNANSTWLNGRPLERDLAIALGRPVPIANDANCFALSRPATERGGSAKRVRCHPGTGTGGGLVDRGARSMAPSASAANGATIPCLGCSLMSCQAPMLVRAGRLHGDMGFRHRPCGQSQAHDAAFNDSRPDCCRGTRWRSRGRASMRRHAGRLARGLAHVINIFDRGDRPGWRAIEALSPLCRLPALIARTSLRTLRASRLSQPKWGDASGVRGAAWLLYQNLKAARLWRIVRAFALRQYVEFFEFAFERELAVIDFQILSRRSRNSGMRVRKPAAYPLCLCPFRSS